MNLFYSDVFVLPLTSHHRFPMGNSVDIHANTIRTARRIRERA